MTLEPSLFSILISMAVATALKTVWWVSIIAMGIRVSRWGGKGNS